MRKVYQIEANCRRAIVRNNTEWQCYTVRFYTLECVGWIHNVSLDYAEPYTAGDRANMELAMQIAIDTASLWVNS